MPEINSSVSSFLRPEYFYLTSIFLTAQIVNQLREAWLAALIAVIFRLCDTMMGSFRVR